MVQVCTSSCTLVPKHILNGVSKSVTAKSELPERGDLLRSVQLEKDVTDSGETITPGHRFAVELVRRFAEAHA